MRRGGRNLRRRVLLLGLAFGPSGAVAATIGHTLHTRFHGSPISGRSPQ